MRADSLIVRLIMGLALAFIMRDNPACAQIFGKADEVDLFELVNTLDRLELSRDTIIALPDSQFCEVTVNERKKYVSIRVFDTLESRYKLRISKERLDLEMLNYRVEAEFEVPFKQIETIKYYFDSENAELRFQSTHIQRIEYYSMKPKKMNNPDFSHERAMTFLKNCIPFGMVEGLLSKGMLGQ